MWQGFDSREMMKRGEGSVKCGCDLSDRKPGEICHSKLVLSI